MDSKKILAIVVVVTLIASAAAFFMLRDIVDDDPDLTVVCLNKNGYEVQMIAEEKGFFSWLGLNVEVRNVSGSGQDAVNAMLAGEADIAFTGEGPVATTMNKYPGELVVLGGVTTATGGQVWVAGPAIADKVVAYDKVNQNKGDVKQSFVEMKTQLGAPVKLGVQQGATTEGEIKAWLKFMDIPFNDFGATDPEKLVTLVNIKANQLVSSLGVADGIDMMAASLPYPSQATSIISGSKVVGSNADIDSYGIYTYVTTTDVYEDESKSEDIKKFLQALKLATDYMNVAENEQECIDICAERIGGQKSTTEAQFEISNWGLGWTIEMSNTLYKTCQKKNFTGITEQMCIDVCPTRDYIATLYA